MTIKSIQTLVSEAMQEIKTINADEALKMVEVMHGIREKDNLD